MAASDVISLGIGSPASIPVFLLFGLSVNPITTTAALLDDDEFFTVRAEDRFARVPAQDRWFRVTS